MILLDFFRLLMLLIVCSSVLPDCAITVLSCKRDTDQWIKILNQIVYYMDYMDLDKLFYWQHRKFHQHFRSEQAELNMEQAGRERVSCSNPVCANQPLVRML